METINTKGLYGFDMTSPDKRRRDEPRKFDIKMLWQRNHEILGMFLSGMPMNDIATKLNITPASVSNTVNSQLGEQKLAEMRKERDSEYIDVGKKVAELAEKALSVYEDILNNDTVSYNLKKATADTLLMDLGGHRAPIKIDSRSVSLSASMEELEEFKRLGHAAAKEAGFLIDIPEGARTRALDSVEVN